MATEALKDRVAALKNELMQIKQELAAKGSLSAPAEWEKMFGIFADSEGLRKQPGSDGSIVNRKISLIHNTRPSRQRQHS